jgi:hypothetical protein
MWTGFNFEQVPVAGSCEHDNEPDGLCSMDLVS